MMIRTKSNIRRLIKKANLSLNDTAKEEAAKLIFNTIEAMPQFTAASNIAIFLSLPDEVPTHTACQHWQKIGKQILIPRVENDIINFYRIEECSMAIGAYGIIEPQPLGSSALVDPAQIELIVTPAVAFTIEGDRLGRGGGYYDRYLSQAQFNGFKIGICYKHQLLEELPTEEHDQRVDIVITD